LTLLIFGLANQRLPAQEIANTWKFVVGTGAINQPKFPGSSESMTRVLPFIGIEYGRVFLGGAPGAGLPAGLGAYLYRDSRWTLGVGLGQDLTKPRKEADSSRLHGLGDIDSTPLGAIFASGRWPWFAIRASVVGDVGGKEEGTRVSLDLEAKYRLSDNITLAAGPGATWADRRYQQTFFGVSKSQSLSSGIEEYTAGSGINNLRFFLSMDLRLNRQWNLGTRFTMIALNGQAEKSPITEKTKTNTLAMFGMYRF
jgi:outer membrane protein